jgi:hypothetical protein
MAVGMRAKREILVHNACLSSVMHNESDWLSVLDYIEAIFEVISRFPLCGPIKRRDIFMRHDK